MPTFDELLDTTSEEELSDADVIGLAGYYLREIQEEYPFSTSQIRDLVEPSLRYIPSNSISAYPSQLKKKGHFQRRDNKWDLTKTGRSYYEDLVSITANQDAPRNSNDLFITVDPPEDKFYAPLVEDINLSYRHHIYDATMILTRKLLENLLIEVLRIELGHANHLETFYIPEQNRFQPFSELIENFSEHLEQFRPFMPDLDATFVNDLDTFRTRANANAHSIQVDITQAEIEALSDDADQLVRRLFRLRKQLELAAKSTS